MLNHHKFCFRMALLTAAVCCSPTIQAQDTIALNKKTRGSNVIGRITKTSPEKITITSGNKKREIPTNEIKRVTFSGEPGELRSARNAIASGQYEQALSSLKDITPDSQDSRFILQDIAYYKAHAKAHLAMRGTGNVKQAVVGLRNFMRKEKDSYHLYDATKLLGDLAMALGSYDAAANYYGQFAKATFPDYQMEGSFLTGRALVLNGKFKDAETQFNSVQKSSLNDATASRFKELAKTGLAHCLANQGDTAGAIQLAQSVIDKNDSSDAELFAAAYNALGAAHQTAGQTIDAVLAFVHVEVLFLNQREAHAEALFHLSKLWTDLNKPDRANQARKTLTQRYGGTVWAKRS